MQTEKYFPDVVTAKELDDAKILFNDVSENSKEYFDFWYHTFHVTNKCSATCHCVDRVLGLLKARMDSIRDGMQDVSREVNHIIWKRAFELHPTRCPNFPSSVITGSWVTGGDYSHQKCDCYEVALAELATTNKLDAVLKIEPKSIIQVDPSDAWFEERFE